MHERGITQEDNPEPPLGLPWQCIMQHRKLAILLYDYVLTTDTHDKEEDDDRVWLS